jgi:hypothetical protein
MRKTPRIFYLDNSTLKSRRMRPDLVWHPRKHR